MKKIIAILFIIFATLFSGYETSYGENFSEQEEVEFSTVVYQSNHETTSTFRKIYSRLSKIAFCKGYKTKIIFPQFYSYKNNCKYGNFIFLRAIRI